MKSVLLVVLLAAVASASVVSPDVPDVLKVLDVADGDTVADVDLSEMPDVIDVEKLTDVYELSDEAEETAIDTRRNLSAGTILSGQRPFFNNEVRANGIACRYHTRDIRINASPRRVNAIRVNRVGASQNATPSIIGGGIGSTFVTIRIRSAVGRGYHYRIQVYVR